MNFFVKNLFSKCEHIRKRLRIYSYLSNKFLKKSFFFCVVNVVGSTTQSCKFFFKPNSQSLVYFTSTNTLHRLKSSLLFRSQFFGCSKGVELSAQDLLHYNQYTFRTEHSSNLHWFKKSLETCR